MLAEGGSMAAGLKNHYQVLGLSPGATGEEIKQAYRQQLAHFRAAMTSTERPDPVQLDQLRAAFSTLSDPATRQVYDAHLRAANGFAASTPTPDLLINDEAGQASRVKSAAAEPPPQAEPPRQPSRAATSAFRSLCARGPTCAMISRAHTAPIVRQSASERPSA